MTHVDDKDLNQVNCDRGVAETLDGVLYKFYVESDGFKLKLGVAHSAIGLVHWRDDRFTGLDDVEKYLYDVMGFTSVSWSCG